MVARLTMLNADAGKDRSSDELRSLTSPVANLSDELRGTCVVWAGVVLVSTGVELTVGVVAAFVGVSPLPPPPPPLFAVGVTAFDATEAKEEPRALVAVTVNS
jgi:hypothetical protein